MSVLVVMVEKVSRISESDEENQDIGQERRGSHGVWLNLPKRATRLPLNQESSSGGR